VKVIGLIMFAILFVLVPMSVLAAVMVVWAQLRRR
jgi:hypothetical protein